MSVLKASSLQSLLGSDHGSVDSLLAESLMDLEELDDVEYSIPPTGTLPSLETVLSEFDADSDVTSELGIPMPTPTPSLTDESNARLNNSGGCGSIIRYSLLQGISTQLASATDRINAGYASSCTVCNQYYAVGTSHGHLLNFDINQTLRWAYQDKNGQGAVSAVDYNTDCSRLLAGFARGLILMLETQTGNVMRQLTDAITPNTGVLHVKWTSRPATALVADSGGSVWCLNFTRKLGVRGYSSRCLFSGARGEVCIIEPLIKTTNHHDLDQYCIVALATLSKYFIVTLRPRLKVIKYHILQGPPDCLPLLAWQMVLIQAADTSRSIDPVLVVGRGQQLFFHQLFVVQSRVTLLLLRNIVMPSNLLSVHWLGPKCIACLDTSEILHLMDVRSSKELECIDLGNAGLVYGSAQFKGLATGGNVSPALALAGTHACYNSLAAKGVHLFVLGNKTMHSISVRTWMERISYLVKNQRWQQACDLSLDGYRTAMEKPKRKQQAKERIIMLFKEYLAASARAPDYCLGSIIKCLITVNEMDLLWSQLWERLHNKALFLQHITEHIKSGDIYYVNPIVSQALVNYWLNISPVKLEEIILKMDWRCLDLNQVLKAAKTHKMYRIQIYLNAQALNDYMISLTELIPLLNEQDVDDDVHTDLGNCILVYISSCLAGRGYPSGDIPEQYVQIVKHDVLRCLTSVHSNLKTFEDNDVNKELPYPYMRTLLKFDTRETLNVISLAFQEKEFNGDLGYLHRKHIINILLQIMTPSNATWCEIGCLLNFIAQQISQHCLPCETQLLRKILNYLSMESIENETERMHMERENAWYELLVNNCLDSITNDIEQLQLAKQAHCYYVEEFLLEKLKRYDNILECYLNNTTRHEAMFVYIERNAYDPNRHILQQMKQHIKCLLRIDAKECIRIIRIHFSEHIEQFLQELMNADTDANETLILIYLKCLHEKNIPLSPEQIEMLLELLCKYQANEVEEFLHHLDVNTYRLDKAMDIVKQYPTLTNAAIYLAEKRGDYRLAFNMAMDKLKNCALTKDEIADHVHFIASLCGRCSMTVNDSTINSKISVISNNKGKTNVMSVEQCENLWFELLEYVLSKDELKAITKSMLQEASAYVNLNNLVQLVLNIRNVTGNFGDIKELLLSMLLQAKQETFTRESAFRVLEMELNTKFHIKRDRCNRGLWITMLKCVLCHKRLFNQNSADIIVLGNCGHAMHVYCSQEYIEQFYKTNKNVNSDSYGSNIIDGDDDIHKCLYCLREFSIENLRRSLQWQNSIISIVNTASASQYNDDKITTNRQNNSGNNDNNNRSTSKLGILQLKAPPGKFSKEH